jgi:glutamate-ammonia-ligase adenylyltransferase
VEGILGFFEHPSAQGTGYKIDTRLRPEGSKGALAIPLETFQTYLDTRAEHWERLAWTQARQVAGSAELGAIASRAVSQFVYGPWSTELVTAMDYVRSRMINELAGEKGGERLDFKVGHGALADIDFMLQMIQIREGRRRRSLRFRSTRRLLSLLAATGRRTTVTTPFLSAAEAGILLRSHFWLCRLELLARIEADSNVSSIPTDVAALRPLGKKMGMRGSEGDALLREYRATTRRVRRIYQKVLKRLDKE